MVNKLGDPSNHRKGGKFCGELILINWPEKLHSPKMAEVINGEWNNRARDG